jgi:hypothetical protein
MMIRPLLAGVALMACASLAACSKKDGAKPAATNDKAPPKDDKTPPKDDKTPPKDDKAPPAVEAPDAVPVAVAPGPGAGKLTCDELVPAAVREKYLAGLTLEEEKPSGADSPNNVTCYFSNKAEYKSYTVLTFCDPTGVDDFAKLRKDKLKKVKVLTAGKTAFLGTVPGINGVKDQRIVIVDDDTACLVEASSADNSGSAVADPEGLAKDLAAALTPVVISN